MAHMSHETPDQIEVTHDNEDFAFQTLGSGDVELVFAQTKFRKSDEVEYSTVGDIPSEVIDVLSDEGYSVVSVK